MRKLSLPDVRWCRRLGIEPKTRKLSEEDKRKIVALYKEGYTQQEIAEMMGVSHQRISQILEECKKRHLSPLALDNSNTSSGSSLASKPLQPSSDEKVLDATPYLKGGGTELEESEEQEAFEEEVIDQGHVVEYSEEDFEEPEEVITTPIAEARRGWELFKSAIEALMKV